MNFDFESSFEYILENNTKDKQFEQLTMLDSAKINNAFEQIEVNLNLLYEKGRLLEDIMNYSNLYLKNEINNSIDECKTLLFQIESSRDSVKNNSYVKYPVSLMFGSATSTDRNELSIPQANIVANIITPSSSTLRDYDVIPSELRQSRKSNCIENNFKSISSLTDYRTFYMFKEPLSSPVSEELILKYSKPISINKISMDTTNCDIHSVSALTEEGKTVDIDIDYLYGFSTIMVTEIHIRISTKRYTLSNYDYFKYENDKTEFWNNYNKKEKYDINKPKFYYYLFGIDNITLENVNIVNDSFFVSRDITIGSIKKGEYITVIGDSNANVEISILDGTEEIPVLLEGVSSIVDEKIFHKAPLRFSYDSTKDIIVKCEGVHTELSVQDAIDKNDGKIYTVSYCPVIAPISSLKSEGVSVRCVLRNNISDITPFIKNIQIKKNGGGIAWIEKIMK